MANVVTTPSQGQILVNIEDMSMLKDIKKAISLLKGVGRITVPPCVWRNWRTYNQP